jgi:hypothetical protein
MILGYCIPFGTFVPPSPSFSPSYLKWSLINAWHERNRLRDNGTQDIEPFIAFTVDPFYVFFNHSCEWPPTIKKHIPDLTGLKEY